MKIICIGRNYVDHAKELNNPVPKEPLFFLKPDSSLLPHKHPLYIPEWTQDLHYEVELVVKISRLGKYIEPQHAHKYYKDVSVGIDFTARDVQAVCKEKGHPWEKAKVFDGSAPVGKQFTPISDLGGDVQNIDFWLSKNGVVVQSGNTSDMIFSVNEIICYISQYMTLRMGDYIFTGTPAGVGPVALDDVLKCGFGEKEMLQVLVK